MIYIVGHRGFLGSAFMDYLTERGYEPKGWGKGYGKLEAKPEDTVINTACYGWTPGEEDPWEMLETNANLPIELHKTGANLITFQSGFEHAIPTHPYSRSKGLAANVLSGRAHIIYLYTIFGGPHEPDWRFIRSLLKSCSKGEKYVCTNPWATRDFVHVKHLCRHIETLLDDRGCKTIQFGYGKARSLVEVVGMLKGISGREFDIEFRYHDGNYFEYCAQTPFLTLDTFIQDLRDEWATYTCG